MAEQKSTEPAQGKSRVGEGQNEHKVVQQAPRSVGRHQVGEAVDGPLTTRVPRGVGEAPADALSDEPGVRLTQESVNKAVAEDNERGYRGDSPVSNDLRNAYTVAGVTSGQPTPETTVYTPRGK